MIQQWIDNYFQLKKANRSKIAQFLNLGKKKNNFNLNIIQTVPYLVHLSSVNFVLFIILFRKLN